MDFIANASALQLGLACLLVVGGVSLISTGLGAMAERAFSGSTQIWAVPLRDGQLRHERLSYLRFVVLAAASATAFLSLDWIEFGAVGPAAAALTFAVQWTAFEIYYYGLHRALHSQALYRFHTHHHESHVTTAWTGQSLSVVEALGWIAGVLIPPALASQVVPISFDGFMIYFVANTFVNVAGHANVEVSPLNQRALTWIVHPWLYHALHHARFKNNYSFASTFMDRFCGTEWQDWPELHERVFRGEAMTRLNERGEA
ncbi:MAG: sterol desaturase family protein [Myxococcota bacterium]|nr:sterol desaturase family protein [Myxococcota bacterium]